MRLLLELTAEVRAAIPSSMPLLVRIPGTDWMSHDHSVPAWDIEQCVELAKALSKPEMGVDFLDVTSAGLMAEQKIVSGPGYQAPFSKAVKKAVEGSGMLVGVVGLIKQGDQAEKLLQAGVADVVLVGRAFQKNPALVWQWAEELDVEVRLANQIGWSFGQRAKGGMKGEKPVVE
jgi:2,4-dienoyl-CoA reductase-like NADH-dependent reductase (Old Yellow Enzyme family)